ncbi:MATE family efflux transporter [Mangrovimicrobium sediminis]|uniref:MATE family efflux transporter n=1 Tax=Mangrovimicrobium sediminis TaxID=2562682 RepID=A0A4Z0LW92_9GAMM|nr:MATE family efflux transporter [Haliea sp. SAOS-164]TGD71529.1 MATE family efflux transporter [Haliea sp. SAOS-164]
MPDHSANRFTTGSIPRQLMLFAIPTLASSILQSADGSIDSAWVGKLLGEAALAATTNGNLVLFILISFVFGFGMAATILIGQSIGAGNLEQARRVVGTAAGSFIPLVSVVAVAGYFTSPHLLTLLDTAPEIRQLAQSYLELTFIGLPAVLLQTILMMALRGAGDATTPLKFMFLAVALAALLNPLLILGIGPVPAFGIGGSALSMAVANYISLALMLIYIYRRDLPLRLRGAELRWLRPDLSLLKVMISKGVPIGLQMIIVTTAALTMLRVINAEGVDTIAAFGATQQIWTYVQMPAMALGGAVSAMAAQNIGAGRLDRVRQITRVGVGYNFLLTGGLIVLLTWLDRWALGIFLSDSGAAVEIAIHIFQLATWGFIAFGISQVLFGTVRAAGQVMWPMMILAVALYPVRLGALQLLKPALGSDAIWWSFPAAFVATMVMAIAYYFWGKWRQAGPAIPAARQLQAHSVLQKNNTPRIIEAPANADPTRYLLCSGIDDSANNKQAGCKNRRSKAKLNLGARKDPAARYS